MQEVVNTAERKSETPLYSLYGVENATIGMIIAVLEHGWIPFASMTSLFGLLGPDFIATFAAFVITPIGGNVLAALVGWGGREAILILYNNRVLPIAVKTIGNKYKDQFDSHIDEQQYIDNIINEAADELIRRASYK